MKALKRRPSRKIKKSTNKIPAMASVINLISALINLLVTILIKLEGN